MNIRTLKKHNFFDSAGQHWNYLLLIIGYKNICCALSRTTTYIS